VQPSCTAIGHDVCAPAERGCGCYSTRPRSSSPKILSRDLCADRHPGRSGGGNLGHTTITALHHSHAMPCLVAVPCHASSSRCAAAHAGLERQRVHRTDTLPSCASHCIAIRRASPAFRIWTPAAISKFGRIRLQRATRRGRRRNTHADAHAASAGNAIKRQQASKLGLMFMQSLDRRLGCG
jgi:hypothetical protein